MMLKILCVMNFVLCIKCDKFSVFEKNDINGNLSVALKNFIANSQNSAIRIIGEDDYLSFIDKIITPNSSFELFTKEFKSSPQVAYTNVILYKNLANLEKIFQKEKLQNFRIDAFYILLPASNCNDTMERKAFGKVWKHHIYNINIICIHNNNVLMKTFFPYQKGSCGSTDSIVINKFVNYFWTRENFFPSKFENLHKCQIRVGSFLYPPITMRETLGDGTFRYYGSEFEILSELSTILNFNVTHYYIPKTGQAGLLFDNGTAFGILKQVIDEDVDIIMAFYYLTYQRSKFLSFTQSHYSVPLVIMIPDGRPYTAFEKLFKPFKLVLWYVLILTVGIAILTILLVNCQDEKVKNFVFGSKTGSPFVNLFNVFLNGNTVTLPKRTFARYLLMLFILFSLVIRTIYQGSLYQFMQLDDRTPALEQIDQMIKNDFVFYIRDTLEHNIKNMSFYNRRKVVKFVDYPALMEKTLDSQFKGGIVMPLLEVILQNQQTYKNFTYKVLKEYLFDVQIVYYYPKNFHLVNVINEKVGILKSAGIIPMWMDTYVDKRYVNIKTPGTGPRRISIKQLLGGFEVWFVGLCLSIVIFALELLTRCKYMQFLRKIYL